MFGLSLLITYKTITPISLLFVMFLLGCGAAMRMPAWKTIMSSLVTHAETHNAATLNGMSFNFARAVGPALAGLIALSANISLIFWSNTLSVLGMAFVISPWRLAHAVPHWSSCKQAASPHNHGFSLILCTKKFQALLLRTFCIFFGTSSIWSLLPAFAGIQLRMSLLSTGLLLGIIGAGAVLGGFFIPLLKARLGSDRLTCSASILIGLALLLISLTHGFLPLCFALMIIGFGWAFLVSSLNGTAQSMFPVGIRARALSIYLMSMYGGTSLGGWVWGYLSVHQGLCFSFFTSGFFLFICGFFESLTCKQNYNHSA